jgi:hypothetical protein
MKKLMGLIESGSESSTRKKKYINKTEKKGRVNLIGEVVGSLPL